MSNENDDELPLDPWADPEHPYAGMLDRAKATRMALLDMPDLGALFRAFAALTKPRCVWC